jgi:hypothetical protein
MKSNEKGVRGSETRVVRREEEQIVMIAKMAR